VTSAGADLDDRRLWELAADGQAWAFGALFERHRNAVYNYCFRRTASWDTAEEITSAVFRESWRRRREVVLTRESLRPWLLGVATRLLRSQRRALRRYQAAVRKLPDRGVTPDPTEDIADRVDDERRMARVLAAIRTLPRSQQEVLALCVFAELDYESAAAALGIPVGTVRSRLSRARARLQDRLTATDELALRTEGKPI
jgi:RNA polymerase sigma-70 factor (ECF subfamily)